MKLLFLHGWGFDHAFWAPLTALLDEFERAVDDRGYFGKPIALQADGPCIAVTHSFGTMRLLDDPPPGLSGIVAINGFARFTAPDGPPPHGQPPDSETGVPVRIVERMARRFEQDAQAVLAAFHQQIGNPAWRGAAQGGIDVDLLRLDLLRLRDGQSPLPAVPVLSVQGGRDALLPAAMRATVFDGCTVHRIESETGGHVLPLEKPALCAQAVRDMAKQLT